METSMKRLKSSLSHPAARQAAVTRASTRVRLISLLSLLIALLGSVVAAAGLLSGGPGGSATATTVRGQPVDLFGSGIYRYDTLFTGAVNRGTDFVSLVLAVPLLLVALVIYRRGSLRGAMLLLGALTWFLYVGASYALGAVAYNDLFLVYVALLAASLWTFLLLFCSVNLVELNSQFSPGMPRRGPAIFMFVSGGVTLLVWLMGPVTSLLTGEPPDRMDTYSTLFTPAFDMAVITTGAFIVGRLILRRSPLGYLGAFAMLVLEAMLAPMITAQTVSQLSAGVELTAGEIIGPVGGFVIVAVVAVGFIVAILRHVSATRQESQPAS